ncbi:bag [Symbiodinium sp. CCMP2456]|nr:bag [Symbiodinium sp. CCMP2456]
MYTNSRGSCTKMQRSLESYDRSTWMERDEISYNRFTEGLLDEAETWVTKNFEDMQSALEPVVLSEPKRQYDMNEFERMLRMNEQENEWLDAQRRKTDELMDVHVRLVSRSTASMADSIARVKQALTSLVNEIAEGLRRHNKLVKEHEATEAELYDLARKQKLLQTALEEFEVRKKEATDRYARELETLKTEYGKLKRAVETAQSALVKDKERYNQFWRNLLASLKSKISDQLDVLGQAHIQRIRRQCEVHERQGIMRRSTLEKEIQELRRRLKERRKYLKEVRIRQELTDLRQELYEARLLLFELNARAGEVSETGDPAEGEVLRKLWKTGDATKMPESGLLPLLVQQLQIQRQWLLDRGQGFSLSLRRLLPKGKPLLSSPTSLLQLVSEVLQQRELDASEMSREKLTKVFRSELTRQRTEVLSLVMDMQQGQMDISGLLASDDVYVALEESLRSLEATRRSQEALVESWTRLSNHSSTDSTNFTWVQEELTEKLEDLQKGLTLAETSTKWLQAPTQNSSLVLADLTTREEMRWLTDLTLKLGERCGRLRAGALLVEEAQDKDASEGAYQAVGGLLMGLPAVVDEDLVALSQTWTKRVQLNLEKRQKLHGELASAYRRLSVHQGGQSVKSVFEGVDSLKIMLEDAEFAETGAQDDMTPAELLSILHATAARVFQQSDSYHWAMVGLGGLDSMASEAVVHEQAVRAQTAPRVAEETSGEDMISFSNTNLLDDFSSMDDLQGQITQLADLDQEVVNQLAEGFKLPAHVEPALIEAEGDEEDILESGEEEFREEDEEEAADEPDLPITAATTEPVMPPDPGLPAVEEIGLEQGAVEQGRGMGDEDFDAEADAVEMHEDVGSFHGSGYESPSGPGLPEAPESPRTPRTPRTPSSPKSSGKPKASKDAQSPKSSKTKAQGAQEPASPKTPKSPGSPQSPRSPQSPKSPKSPKRSTTLRQASREESSSRSIRGQKEPMPPAAADVAPQAELLAQTGQAELLAEDVSATCEDPVNDGPSRPMSQPSMAAIWTTEEVSHHGLEDPDPMEVIDSNRTISPRRPSTRVPVANLIKQDLLGAGKLQVQDELEVHADPPSEDLAESVRDTATIPGDSLPSLAEAPKEDMGAKTPPGAVPSRTDLQDGMPTRSGETDNTSPRPPFAAPPDAGAQKQEKDQALVEAGAQGCDDVGIESSAESSAASALDHFADEGRPEGPALAELRLAGEVPRAVLEKEPQEPNASDLLRRQVSSPSQSSLPDVSPMPSAEIRSAGMVMQADQTESTETLATWVAANISRRLSAAGESMEPGGAVHIGETEASRRLSSVRSGLGIGGPASPTSSSGLQQGKKKARRPKALTRLGQSEDEEILPSTDTQEDAMPEEVMPEENVDITPEDAKCTAAATPSGLAQRVPESAPAPVARKVPAAPVQPQLAAGEKEMEMEEGKDEEEKEKEEDVVEQPRDYERPKRIDPHNTAASLMTGRSQNADDLEKMALADMAGDALAVAAYAQSALESFQPASESSGSASPVSPLSTRSLHSSRSPQRRLPKQPAADGAQVTATSPSPVPSNVNVFAGDAITEEPKFNEAILTLDAEATTSRNAWAGKAVSGRLPKKMSIGNIELEDDLGWLNDTDDQAIKTATASLTLAKPGRLLPRSGTHGVEAEDMPILSVAQLSPRVSQELMQDDVSELHTEDEPKRRRQLSADVPVRTIERQPAKDPRHGEALVLLDAQESSSRHNNWAGQSASGPSQRGGSELGNQTKQPFMTRFELKGDLLTSGAGDQADRMPHRSALKPRRGKPRSSAQGSGKGGKGARRPQEDSRPGKAAVGVPEVDSAIVAAVLAEAEADGEGPEEAEEPEAQEEILEAETKPSDSEKVKVEVNEEADPKDNFSLARNASKTAVNKRYVVASAGKKALFQSRSFRMQDGDVPAPQLPTSGVSDLPDPGESGEAPVLIESTESTSQSQTEPAKKRWKLGTLAVQAVLRLRSEAPSPPPQRRDSGQSNVKKTQIVRELEPPPPPPESITAPTAPATKPRPKVQKVDKASNETVSKTEENNSIQTLHEAPAAPENGVDDGINSEAKALQDVPQVLLPNFAAASLDNGASLALTAAAIQAMRSLDEPDLSHFRKSEARLLSAARTQTTGFLSHDSSRITFFSAKTDSANSTAGFSPYTSQTDLLKNASGTTLSYQSSAAKLSIASIEEEAGSNPSAQAKVTASEADAQWPTVGALEEELIGGIVASPSPEPDDEDAEAMTGFGYVLEMRKPPPAISTSRRGSIKVFDGKVAPEGLGQPTPSLVLSNLAKPSPRQPASARGARELSGATRRRPVYS